jgi:hypothetical protein
MITVVYYSCMGRLPMAAIGLIFFFCFSCRCMKTLIFPSGRNLAESDWLVVTYDHLAEKSDQNTLDFQPKDAILLYGLLPLIPIVICNKRNHHTSGHSHTDGI